MELDFNTIILAAMSIVGFVEWIKNFNKNWITKNLKWISFILCAGFACLYNISNWTMFNVLSMFGVLLATTELGYQTLMKPILNLVEALVNKTQGEK